MVLRYILYHIVQHSKVYMSSTNLSQQIQALQIAYWMTTGLKLNSIAITVHRLLLLIWSGVKSAV